MIKVINYQEKYTTFWEESQLRTTGSSQRFPTYLLLLPIVASNVSIKVGEVQTVQFKRKGVTT